METMVQKSTNLLLNKTFTSCLTSLFQKPHLTLFEVIQILIDTSYLEKSSIYLEEFVFNVTGYNDFINSFNVIKIMSSLFIKILYLQISFQISYNF